jgi:hypothetical protein
VVEHKIRQKQRRVDIEYNDRSSSTPFSLYIVAGI